MIRDAPLPGGMELLLRIAAGDRAAIADAMLQTERSEAVLRQAAEFFIEQILMSPVSGSYRVLGANRDASGAELRHNMALLVRWMHPDVAASVDRSMFAGRVTLAWDDLKTAERRAAYDAGHDARTDETNGRSAMSSNRGAKSSRLRPRRSRRRFAAHERDSWADGPVTELGRMRRAWLRLLRRLQD